MRQRRSLLSLSVPLGLVGCLVGHAAGYAIVSSSREDARIHGYLGYAPLFLAASLVFVAGTLAVRVVGRLPGRPAAWPFAFLPPLAFVAQELIERLAAGLPAYSVFEPAVYVGLAAQLPIGVLAFVVARTLLRVADEVGCALRTHHTCTLAPVSLLLPAELPSAAVLPLAFDHLGRAPPAR